MRVVFFGTPLFAKTVLQKLKQHHEIVAVICQPDKIGNRNKLEVCQTKKFCLENDLPVFQFESVSKEAVSFLKSLDADLHVTAAFGQMLSQELLDIPRFGTLNVHGSLLPKYRGAAPIQWALLNGEKATGVTIMKTALQMDAGDILLQKKLEIEQLDAVALYEKLANLGGDALIESIEMLENKTAVFAPQKEKDATFCKKIDNKISEIAWCKKSNEIVNQVRGLTNDTVAFSKLNGEIVKFFEVEASNENFEGKIGSVVKMTKKDVFVKTNDGAVKVLQLQFAGGKKIFACDAINGRKIAEGDVFGE